MSGFHDVRLPLRFALGASGGIERRTQIVPLTSGRETRNGVWAGSKRSWELAGTVQKSADVAALIDFFEARSGRLFGFRFRDPLGHVATGEVLGTADGEATVFQLVKRAGDSVRSVTKPVDGSVRLFVGGVEAVSGWTLHPLTGQVTFDGPPDAGQAITADFEFDVPVRFDTDRLETRLDGFGTASLVSVPLIELIN
jgi:uncharacterized protein (TIGR02217 family)